MSKYNMSFWNYVQTGVLSPKEAVKDWEHLGMNLATSFEYNPQHHKKSDMIELLDECGKHNMKVIVCDSRTDFNRVKKIGEEQFLKEVQEAVEDFGSHPAVFGFHVGDEPNKNSIDSMIFAYKTVKQAAPHLSPYVNLLPVWYEDNFYDAFDCTQEEYKQYLDDLVKKAGLEMLSYDCYAQCCYFEEAKHQWVYFKNLEIFGEVARKNNIPLFTSLLSVGHWSLRCPTLDDFRWQISTAVAMGVTGIIWFFLYERTLDTSFRMAPIDMFYEKTETYHWLSRENRCFMQFIAPKLEKYKWNSIKALNVDIPGAKNFKIGDYGLQNFELDVYKNAPILFAEFEGEKDTYIVIVNADRKYPTSIRVKYCLEKKIKNYIQWVAPGQIMLVRVDNDSY